MCAVFYIWATCNTNKMECHQNECCFAYYSSREMMNDDDYHVSWCYFLFFFIDNNNYNDCTAFFYKLLYESYCVSSLLNWANFRGFFVSSFVDCHF